MTFEINGVDFLEDDDFGVIEDGIAGQGLSTDGSGEQNWRWAHTNYVLKEAFDITSLDEIYLWTKTLAGTGTALLKSTVAAASGTPGMLELHSGNSSAIVTANLSTNLGVIINNSKEVVLDLFMLNVPGTAYTSEWGLFTDASNYILVRRGSGSSESWKLETKKAGSATTTAEFTITAEVFWNLKLIVIRGEVILYNGTTKLARISTNIPNTSTLYFYAKASGTDDILYFKDLSLSSAV